MSRGCFELYVCMAEACASNKYRLQRVYSMYMPFMQVSHSGVEEFLWKCKLFQKLNSDIADNAATPSAAGSSKAAEAVLDFRLQHSVRVAKKANEAAGKTADVAACLSADNADAGAAT